MAQKEKFEIYESLSKRKKKYIVADYAAVRSLKAWHSFTEYSRKFFKCSLNHIDIHIGYVYEDELYFENPEKPGARLVSVLTYIR